MTLLEAPLPANPFLEARGGRPGRLIVLSGASGSGKSTLVQKVLQRPGFRLEVSISATTRAPRAGEVPGRSYEFMTREAFEAGRDRGEFLEWAEVHGNLYGTPLPMVRRAIDRGVCLFLVIDVQGALKVREVVPDAVLIFVHTPSLEILEARLRTRQTDDEQTIQKRLANARAEIELSRRYDHQIINDDIDRAVDDLAAILNQYPCGGVIPDA